MQLSMTSVDRRSPWVRGALTVSLCVSLAVVLGVVMPRGPMSTPDSVGALALCAGLGVLAGRLVGRWAVLLAPASFAMAFELVRLGADGPTVDRPVLGTIYAALALLVGRGFDGLVLLAPMVVGGLWGAALRRRAGRPSAAAHATGVGVGVRRVLLGLATAAVLLLVVALVRPSSTSPVVGPDGAPLAGSIAELVTVPIGGVEQSIMLRGARAEAPVLLFLEGGPGGTAVGSMRASGEPLERSFVVATWDQRGTGRSAEALEDADSITVAQSVDDTIEVTEYLRRRFDQKRIYLVGSSWGSTLGVLAAQRRPDLFAAYVGCGQMVDQAETDRRMYAESVAYAQRVGDAGFAAQLTAIGPPPYSNLLDYPVALSTNPEWHEFVHGDDWTPRSSYPMNLLVPEFSLTEQVRAAAGLVDTFATLYPQLQSVDFRTDVPALDVPVYVVLGAHEADGRSSLVREWLPTLQAPSVTLVEFDRSGHVPHLDEPGRFADLMTRVLQETGSRLG